MRIQIIMLLLLSMPTVSAPHAAPPEVFILGSAEWNVPRTTQSIIDMPAVKQAVQAYENTAAAGIELRYAGGDEGTLWANELRSWLVALGITSTDIELLPGGKTGQLELRVVSNPLRQRAQP